MPSGRRGLWAEGLRARFDRRWVVDDVSLSVEPGCVVGLLGPNGAGKTTTFHLLTGLIAPEAGRIFLGDREITRWPFHRRARLGLNYLPQEPSVFRKLSVLQNVLVVLEARGIPRPQRRPQAAKLLKRLGIDHLAQQRADTLSAGERRRVEIARALAASPRFLLLDEPFTGIDPLSIEELHHIIQQLQGEGLGIVITDHNVRETLQVTGYVYLIHDGQVFWEGRPEEMAESSVARRFYLGERFRL
jgi:lipopolysaccharide export system ATP-binding protein